MKNKTIIASILIICILIISSLIILQNKNPSTSLESDNKNTYEIKRFSSYEEFSTFIKKNAKSSNNYYYATNGILDSKTLEAGREMVMDASAPTVAKESYRDFEDYSTTNIQVQGVDEPDIIKNDDRYIYKTTQNKIQIIDTQDSLKLLSEISLSTYYNSKIFINNDKLILIDQGYESIEYSGLLRTRCFIEEYCPAYSIQKTILKVYDISDKSNPKMITNISTDGSFIEARMIKNQIYLITQKPVNINFPDERILPTYDLNGVERSTPINEIYYYDGSDENFVFSIISSLNLDNSEFNQEVLMTGYSSNIYVSQDNIYLLNYVYKDMSDDIILTLFVEEVVSDVLPQKVSEINAIMNSQESNFKKWNDIQKIVEDYYNSLSNKEKLDFSKNLEEKYAEFEIKALKDREKTIIHKINIENGRIDYQSKGEVPGRTLNQFSLDEYENNLRIATTTGNSWNQQSLNHIYILDSNLNIIGSVENLAQGETIYSSRFINDKVYMVTYRQVDPFYVIDLSNPEDPEVLGYLKIPGFSEYLHPYDDTHIIGIGKDATDSGQVQGLKIALFDISEFANPKEIDKILIGDRGSYTPVSYDHKAFLLSKEKGILVLPATVTKINESSSRDWPETYFNGAFIFNINKSSLSLKGKVTHSDNANDYQATIQRSLYINNNLFTISEEAIKSNDIQTLNEQYFLKLETKYQREDVIY